MNFKDNPTADKIVLKAQWRVKNSAKEDTIPDSGQGIQLRTDHDSHYKTEHFFVGEDNIGKPIAFSQNVKNYYGNEWDTDGVDGMTFGPKLKKGSDSNITPYRIHGEIAINATAKGDPNNPLYIFIRPEYSNLDKEVNYTTVRQIVIHINAPNIADDCRPLIFIYDNPPMVSKEATNVNSAISGKPIRDPKPIILNINGDFKGGIYAPCTSVIVEGHNHELQGFVMAQHFVAFNPEKTDEDKILVKGYTTYLSEEKDYIYYLHNFDKYICKEHNEQHVLHAPMDSYGNVLYQSGSVYITNIQNVKSLYHLSDIQCKYFGFNGLQDSSDSVNSFIALNSN